MATFSRLATVGAISLVCTAALASPSFAQGKGHGGGGGGGAGAGATNLNSNGINALDRDRGTDRAGDRMSAQGLANTNGPNSTDRDTGKVRALDRRHK